MLFRPSAKTVDKQGVMATGYLNYIGEPFTDPRIEANQIPITDAVTGEAISNPFSTNGNGDPINSNGERIYPEMDVQAYSWKLVNRNSGNVWDEHPNVLSDAIPPEGEANNVVDRVFDYLDLAKNADLSDDSYIFVRSELEAPTDPQDSRYFHADGTTGTPSSGDIEKFYDSEGKGFARDTQQRFDDVYDNTSSKLESDTYQGAVDQLAPIMRETLSVVLPSGGGSGLTDAAITSPAESRIRVVGSYNIVSGNNAADFNLYLDGIDDDSYGIFRVYDNGSLVTISNVNDVISAGRVDLLDETNIPINDEFIIEFDMMIYNSSVSEVKLTYDYDEVVTIKKSLVTTLPAVEPDPSSS